MPYQETCPASDVAGGAGRQPWVHVVPLPDDYRGPYKRDDPEAGAKYAAHVADIVARLRAEDHGLAACITYHRGQVVTMLRQLGRVPPNTGLISFYRETSKLGTSRGE